MRVAARSAATAATTLIVLVLAACGGDSTACYLLDMAGSTRAIQADYIDHLSHALEREMNEGNAVRVLLVRGDPRTESVPLEGSFAGLTGLEKQPARMQERTRLMAAIDGQIADIEAGVLMPTNGSAIVAGLDILTAKGCEAGVTALTDGLETVAFSAYKDPIENPAERRRLASALTGSNGELAGLEGLRIAFPYGGVVLPGTGLSAERTRALEPVWVAIVRAAGGRVTWRAS